MSKTIFADWHAVLSAVECHKLGHNVFVDNPCDYWGRVHVYGRLWLLLGKLGLGLGDVFWLGLLIVGVFMLVVVVLINPSAFDELLIGTAVSFSPAIMFAIERANVDLIIFELVIVAAFLIANSHRYGQAGGLLVTTLAVFLKFYPAVLFGVIPLFSKNRKEFLTAALGGLSVLGLWLYISADDLVLVQHTLWRPPGPYATGGTLLFKYICPTCRIVPLSWGTAAAALPLAVLLSRKISAEPWSIRLSRRSLVLFCFGLAVLLATFLVTTNYDYRWVFFFMLMPMLIEIWREPRAGKMARKLVLVTLVCGLLVMWCEAFISYAQHALGFILGALPQTSTVQKCLEILKQAAAWISLFSATVIASNVLIESRVDGARDVHATAGAEAAR